jgi:hypothetical protein
MTDTGNLHTPGLSIDQQLALRTAATRLQQQFDGVFGSETIERFLHSSYDQVRRAQHHPSISPATGRTLYPATPARTSQSGGSPQ